MQSCLKRWWPTSWLRDSHFLCNQKVHYCLHESLNPKPNSYYVIPVYTVTHLSMMHCNIILSFIPTSPKQIFPFKLNNHNFLCTLTSPMCVICPAHLLILDKITPGTLGEKYELLRPSLCTQTWSSREGGPPVWRFPRLSGSKIWSSVPRESEPRITVLVKTSTNFPDR